MWEFIKYCLYCLFMLIPASFGYNPDGMTLKNCLVGAITLFTLLFLTLGILLIITIIVQKVRTSRVK